MRASVCMHARWMDIHVSLAHFFGGAQNFHQPGFSSIGVGIVNTVLASTHHKSPRYGLYGWKPVYGCPNLCKKSHIRIDINLVFNRHQSNSYKRLHWYHKESKMQKKMCSVASIWLRWYCLQLAYLPSCCGWKAHVAWPQNSMDLTLCISITLVRMTLPLGKWLLYNLNSQLYSNPPISVSCRAKKTHAAPCPSGRASPEVSARLIHLPQRPATHLDGTQSTWSVGQMGMGQN